MKQRVVLFTFLAFLIHAALNGGRAAEYINLGKFTEEKIAEIIKKSSKYSSNSKKINFISGQFIGVPYMESMLIGDDKTEEVLTINLAGLDCFTYIDYVEAIRLSSKYSEFRDNLIKVRYKEGNVSYKSRNHFFSNWPNLDSGRIEDITETVGGDLVIPVAKSLNEKKDGTRHLAKIPVVVREIGYIPSDRINKSVTDKLQTGDYVGIYTHKVGLDVSHTGIIIRKGNKWYLRHASSRKANRRVVDEELLNYLNNKSGIVVYRPL